MRLRQVALVARDLDAVTRAIETRLRLRDPYHDPEVAHFGLRNAVYPAGDGFLEVVSPVREGTAAGRHLDRLGGDGGYMAIFQVSDVAAARARAAALGVRIAWQIDLPGMSATHLHPADVPGAIVSLDQADPPGSWRWAGTAAGRGGAGGIASIRVAVPDPEHAAARWAAVLGAPPAAEFVAGDRGIDRVRLRLPGPAGEHRIAGVTFEVSPLLPG